MLLKYFQIQYKYFLQVYKRIRDPERGDPGDGVPGRGRAVREGRRGRLQPDRVRLLPVHEADLPRRPVPSQPQHRPPRPQGDTLCLKKSLLYIVYNKNMSIILKILSIFL